ncbi:MAG: hypothetical protein ABI645_09535 [Pseudomonadota bacterium]
MATVAVQSHVVSRWLAGIALVVALRATAAGSPPAPGQELLAKYCTACHSLERVQRSGGTVAGWDDRIRRMLRWGAKIPPEQVPGVATYLASILPPRPRPPASLTWFANTAVSDVAPREIQTTLRAAATFDPTAKSLIVSLTPREAGWVTVGQRVRAFSLGARSAMIGAKVSQIVKQGSGYRVVADLMSTLPDSGQVHLVEIFASQGVYLAIPSEAIVDDGERQYVYVVASGGDFRRQAVETGSEGDSLVQVVSGLDAGQQVVTLGAFFVDAEFRLKGEM